MSNIMIQRVCFSIVAAALCVIMSTILHLIGFKVLGMYCTISGGIFVILSWIWIMKWIREI